jgi:hypothetical protein
MKHFPSMALALLLAGCATPGADLDATSALVPANLFGPSVEMDQATTGAEPNIAIAPDGTLWITAVAGSQERPNHEQGAAWLWRSRDDGTTWETLREPQRDTPLGTVPGTRRPFGSSDADVVTSPDGYVYYSDWWNWGAPVTSPVGLPIGLPISPFARYGSYLVERSADGGTTWDTTSITTLDSFGGIDRQWLIAGDDGWVGLFYAYFHGPNPSRPTEATDVLSGYSSIQAVYSRDHGATWSDPTSVTGPTDKGFSQIAHPRLSPDGLLWMPHGYTANTPAGGYWEDPSEVRVALSDDLGTTWRDVKVTDVPEGFDNLWAVQGDVAADGTMHVAWSARTGETMTLFHASSSDRGATWSTPHALRAEGLNFLPWVAARDETAAIAWYGSNATGDPAKAPDDTEWSLYVARLGADGWNVSPVGSPVKVGAMCPRGAACPSDRELLDYPSIAFGPDGRLHASFATSRDLNGAKAGLVNYVSTSS